MQLPPVAVVSTTSFPHYTIAKCRFVTLQRPPIPLTFPARHRQHIRRPTCLSSAEAQGNPDTALVGKLYQWYQSKHSTLGQVTQHICRTCALFDPLNIRSCRYSGSSDNMHHKYGYLFEDRCTISCRPSKTIPNQHSSD